jgi:hypothetical protein
MKIVILIFFCFWTLISSGQLVDGELYHRDPYKITNLIFFNLRGFEKTAITKNKIKRISCHKYKLDKRLQVRGKGHPVNYSVKFNADGNPISYVQSDCKKNCQINEYFFDYDSSAKLIHIRELLRHPYDVRYDDTDIFLFYDQENNVEKEYISAKSIYPPGYKYRGTPYENDTAIFSYHINYNDKNIITSIVKYRSDYKSWTNAKEFDSIRYSCSFDSIFISNKEPKSEKGIIKDAHGNIIEMVFYRYLHASPTNDTQFVFRYEYDNLNRVTKTQLFTATNVLSNTWYFEYNQDGLLQAEKYIDSKNRWVTVYRYDKY